MYEYQNQQASLMAYLVKFKNSSKIREIPGKFNMGLLKNKSNAIDIDLILLKRISQKDHQAFKNLVNRYQQNLMSIARYFCQTSAYSAEDLVQDVFLEVYRCAHKFKGDAQFSTWLYSITKYIYLRKAKKFPSITREPTKQQSENYDLPETLYFSDDQATEIEHHKNIEKIKHCIKNLDFKSREILYLADYANYNYQEIANILDIKIGTVRSRLHSARQKLMHLFTLESQHKGVPHGKN